MPIHYNQQLRYEKGFTLLELMIAMVILAIGLLGMIAMQAVALSSHMEAQFRTQALALAEDLSSKMHANREYVNINIHKYPEIPADHNGFNVYSDITNWDYNDLPSNLISEPINTLLASPTTDINNINLRAQADVMDIRRQLKPESGLMLPDDSLVFVNCTDKDSFDYNHIDSDPGDNCSPGSVYTIYVIWPISSSRAKDTDVSEGNNKKSINGRCEKRLLIYNATSGNTLLPENAGCVLLDVVP